MLKSVGFDIENTFNKDVLKETLAFVDEGKPIVK
jgi:hypothetical protein